jgi:hypothetical protein
MATTITMTAVGVDAVGSLLLRALATARKPATDTTSEFMAGSRHADRFAPGGEIHQALIFLVRSCAWWSVFVFS